MTTSFSKSAYSAFLVWGILSSLSLTISTFIDAVLVGNFLGSDGLAASSISTPVYLFYALLGITLGFGANVLIGQKLGASDLDGAREVFTVQIIFGSIIGVLCLVLCLVFQSPLIRFLGAEGPLIPLAEEYLGVVFWAAPIYVLYHILSASVRSDGDPKLVSVSSGVVIVVNLVLDLVFMKGMNMGIRGASLSLCIGKTLGLLVLLFHFTKKTALLRFRRPTHMLRCLRDCLHNGFGIGTAYIFQALVMMLFNNLLVSAGGENCVLHVAFFGVIYTMSTVPFALFDSAGNALSPVITIFSGEQDDASILEVIRYALRVIVVFGLLITGVFLCFPDPIIAFFGIHDAAYLPSARLAFRVYALCTVFTGINMVCTSYWQSIGRARLAGIMSIARNLILMLVSGALLIPRLNILGLAVTYVVTEVLCTGLAAAVMVFSSSRDYVIRRFHPLGRVFEKTYVISPDSIQDLAVDMEQLCEQWTISPKQTFFMNLVLEELILNIIKFGLKSQEKPRYVAIKVIDKGGRYFVRIRDNVDTYNPFESSGDDLDNAVINMIKKETLDYSYQRKLIFNYLYFVI